jgi:hypothetical protein
MLHDVNSERYSISAFCKISPADIYALKGGVNPRFFLQQLSLFRGYGSGHSRHLKTPLATYEFSATEPAADATCY